MSNENKFKDSELYSKLSNRIEEVEGYRVTKEYNRSLYDSNEGKKIYKDSVFGEKKTIKCSLTGEVLHRDHKAAKNKFQSNASKHSAEADHIDPISNLYKRNKDKKYLNDNDVKEVVNRQGNFQCISKSVNTSKKDSTNFEALGKVKYSEEVSINGKIISTIDGEVKSIQNDIRLEAISAGRRIEVAVDKTMLKSIEFGYEAKKSVEDAAMPLMIEGVNNLIMVANGDKEFNKAAKDMGKLTGKIIVKDKIINEMTNVMKKSSSDVLRNISANSNQITQVINVALILKDSTIRFVNGEINGSEFFEEIGKKGVELVAGSIAMVTGKALAASLALPNPLIIGMVCSMIVSVACGELYKQIKSLKDHEKKADSIEKLASSALAEMGHQRKILEGIIENELKVFDDSVTSGFNLIYDAMVSNDMEAFAGGLDTILSVFNESVTFKTREEFNDFFDNEDSILNL